MSFKIKDYSDEILASEHKLLEYENLPEERSIALRKLINNLATNSITQLFSSLQESLALGRQITGTHPFTVWEFFLSEENVEIQRKIKIITDIERCTKGLFAPRGYVFDALKTQFIEGFAKSSKERHEQNDLLPHLGTFAERVNIPVEELQAFIGQERWKELIMRLIPQ